MEDEIEDIVGDVKLTDSQKSVATSNVYSMDFTDSSSDKNNSSGKDTYVIEQDDSDSSDSDSYPIHKDITVIDLKSNKNKDANVQCQVTKTISRAASTSLIGSIAHETFTQTSKTIFELAQADCKRETLETQTSYVSITSNKTLQYTIEMRKQTGKKYETVLTSALEERSSKFQPSDSETFNSENSSSSDDRIINILDAESKENILSDDNHKTQYEHTSEYEDSNQSDNSVDRDSLMETKDGDELENDSVSEASEVPKSIDDEIEDLYHKLTESRDMHARDRGELQKRYRTLTPLTEESTIVRESLIDITSESKNFENTESEKDIMFTNFAGGKVKMLPKEEREFKLPPIPNRSCPNSPQLNFLFSVHPSTNLMKGSTLPCVYEAAERGGLDRWEIDTKNLASGESALISGRNDSTRTNGSIHLPPIHIEGYTVESKISKAEPQPCGPADVMDRYHSAEQMQEAISIKEKIKELKMTKNIKSRAIRAESRSDSRSGSPSSGDSTGGKLCDAAERGCDALCIELLRRLRSSTWYEVSDTLGEIPRALEKFWPVISENRIADLIRQVSAQIESPRTQVARAACSTLASILKNTNYTKKPDFNEAISLLLTKTGSFSRPVRRAANVALDAVVCGVELSHGTAALCVHGVEHKSGLVRTAAARLLVVSCALAGGGRELLRTRPASAAAARRATLRALAALLDDKNTDARRYAERLYSMLRPLPNFEAYYLNDVEVERASRQMKKYDRCLRNAPTHARDGSNLLPVFGRDYH